MRHSGSGHDDTVLGFVRTARVKANNGSSCDSTPCTFRLSRKDAFDVTVSKAGYQPQTVHVRSKAATAGVAEMTGGNFLLGGPIGAGVDAMSGATNELAPNPLTVTLVPVTATKADAAPPAPTAALASSPDAPAKP